MQLLEGSGMPVLYIGRTVLKGERIFYHFVIFCRKYLYLDYNLCKELPTSLFGTVHDHPQLP
jgi:hypothetical protein